MLQKAYRDFLSGQGMKKKKKNENLKRLINELIKYSLYQICLYQFIWSLSHRGRGNPKVYKNIMIAVMMAFTLKRLLLFTC